MASAGVWVRNSRAETPRVPGDNPESRAVPGGSRRPARARAGPALGGAPPPTAAVAPAPPRTPARGSPLSSRARPHTHHTQAHRPGPAALTADALGHNSPLPSPSLAPPSPTPAPGAPARRTLHSPEFLHVCGRGLRETKREGQQAGVVRSAAAPGGAGHRGHSGGAPGRASVVGKSGPRAPSPHSPAAVPGTQGVRGASAE